MEDFVVERKADEELFYVVQMPEELSGNAVVLLANYASGDFKAVTMQVLMQEYSLHDLVENMEDDEEDEGEEEGEDDTAQPAQPSPSPGGSNSFITN